MIPLLILYALIPAYQIYAYLVQAPFYEGADLINVVASIACYFWMLGNVMLSTKLPVLQRVLPYDARIRFHIIGTVGITVTLIYHAFYKIAIGKIIDIVSWTLLGLFVLLLLLSVLWIPLPGVKTFRQKVVGFIRPAALTGYDVLKRLHSIVFLALAGFMYLHIFQTDTLFITDPVSSAIYTLSFGLALGLFFFSKLRMWFAPALRIESVAERGGILRLTLSGKRLPKYRAGQFAFLRFDTKELRQEEHPFSFMSSPDQNHLSFGIRALGDFTRKLGNLAPGTKVRVNGGYGAFYPRGKKPLCFVASGIGTVPFVSILKDLRLKNRYRKILCFFSVDSEAQLPDPAEMELLRAEGLDLRTLVYERDGLRYGPDFFGREVPNPADYDYYLCSSPMIAKIVRTSLKGLGVRSSAIHSESFAFG